ncbi:MAG: single-stranded-DNA-specific exonuclease RecJ, partial [Spirochaetaceae bacterium]|nr:single-stranded-DNA-specific exonuclease RecJ [Spirochaetaceae bacterium]
LRFGKTELYKQQLCLFNVRPMQEDSYCVEIIKTVNCCEISRMKEFVIEGTPIEHTKLCNFLQGQQILVWDAPMQKQILKKIFGSGIEFNFFEAYEEIVKTFPFLADHSLFRLSGQSKIAKYCDRDASEIDAFLNIYITFLQKKLEVYGKSTEMELQLVCLSTLADIMPLRNENRILVKAGLNSINSGKLRPGLLELVTAKKGIGKKMSTIDISWEITPVLNATGRLGTTDKAINLFLEEDPLKRQEICKEIIDLNSKRREIEMEGLKILQDQAEKSIAKFYNKIVFVFEPQVSRGFTGLLANSLFKIHKIPAFVLTKTADNIVVGSARCGDGCKLTDILANFEHMFLNHGGHSKAAGFSLEEKNLADFENELRNFMESFNFSEEATSINVDAELPHKYINHDILKIINDFEPYGEKNPAIIFMSKDLSIISANTFAKNYQSMNISLSGSGITWPCVWWNSAERFKNEFSVGDKVNILFTPYEDTFSGNRTLKLKIIDMEKSC